MAYSEIEQSTLDLDLFFKDEFKNIHIASGGGKIPELLANSDTIIENFKNTVESLEENFEIEINPDLTQILNIENEELENYLSDFVNYARKGFYSYDKTKLGDFEDMTFHLVAKPKNQFLSLKKGFEILRIENSLPETFKEFKLNKFIE